MIMYHQQLILRVPDSISQQIKAEISKHAVKETSNMIVEIESETDSEGKEIEGKEDCFLFRFNNSTYPALLLNLPTLIETQKTFDRKIFYKSGDIGQMIHVFENESSRDLVKSKQTKIRNGELYYINGLTSPTSNIIKNRFELTSKSTGDNYPAAHKVKSVINDIAAVWNIQEEKASIGGLSDGTGSESVAGGTAATGSEYLDIITEEVVEFQEWMVANTNPSPIIISNDSISSHQQQLQTQSLSILGPPLPSKNGLIGQSFHIDGDEWHLHNKLGIALEHPEILEAPNEENVFVIR